jgi:rhodanese-related sulfurtransferase
MFVLKILVGVFILVFPVCDLLWYALGVRRTLPWDLKKMLHRKGPFVIDVSSGPEYRMLHIPSAVNRPDLLSRRKPLPFSIHQPLVIVCTTGHRSPLAVKRLQKMGYRNVTALAWGMLGWKLAGGTTTKGPELK